MLLLSYVQKLCSDATMQTIRTDNNEIHKLVFQETDNDRKVSSSALKQHFMCNISSTLTKKPKTKKQTQSFGRTVYSLTQCRLVQSFHPQGRHLRLHKVRLYETLSMNYVDTVLMSLWSHL